RALDDDLGDAVGERPGLARRVVRLDDQRLAVLAEEVEVAPLEEGVLGRVGDVDDLDRALQRYATRDPEEHAVYIERRVERGERLVLDVGVAAEVLGGGL